MAAEVTEVLARFSAYTEPRDGLGDNPFKLGCSLTTPATDEEIRSAWPTASLPAELVKAWSVSRESRLFEDVDYDQWGLLLLSPAASAQRTAVQRAQRPGAYRPDDVVIGTQRPTNLVSWPTTRLECSCRGGCPDENTALRALCADHLVVRLPAGQPGRGC